MFRKLRLCCTFHIWKSGNSSWVRGNIITRVLMQFCTANDPIPRHIGLTTNHTNIAANKVLFHIRSVALSRITKRKSTSKTLHRAAMRRSYAPGRTRPFLFNDGQSGRWTSPDRLTWPVHRGKDEVSLYEKYTVYKKISCVNFRRPSCKSIIDCKWSVFL